jgi:aldehyde dehydrogenase (NAD+)
MAVMGEEIFGPLLPVLRYERLEEVMEQIHSRHKPLAMYLFSQDKQTVDRLLRHTSAGGTCVNTVVVHLAHSELPFGGIGESGVGNYHGEYGFRTFSHERSVLRQGSLSLLHLLFPPYSEKARKRHRLFSWLFE